MNDLFRRRRRTRLVRAAVRPACSCTRRSRRRRGAILVAALILLLVVTLATGLIVRRVLANQRQWRADHRQLQALLLADAGEELALRRWHASAQYTGETWQTPSTGEAGPGRVVIRIESLPDDPQHKRLVVEASFPELQELSVRSRRERTIHVPSSGDSS